MSSSRAARLSVWVWLAFGMLLVVVGTTASAFSAGHTASGDADRSRRAFAASSAEVASTLELAIKREEDLVVSARGYFAEHPRGTQAEFLRWANSVQALERYPEIATIGSGVIVRDSELAAYVKVVLADPAGPLPPGKFQITPPGKRPFYCLINTGQYRVAASAWPANLDACALPEFGPALLASRDSGQAAYLPEKVGGSEKLIIEIPVYRGADTPATVAARRAAFIGLVGLGMDPTVLLDRALQGHPGTAVSMRYRSGVSDVTFHSGAVARGERSSVVTDLHNGWTVTTVGPVVAGGVFANGSALMLLGSGVGVSLLLGVLVFVLGTGRGRALRLVERKTGEIQYMALHDALTGLPNRALILDRVGHALARARREGVPLAVMFLDLDGFKGINDTFGHAAGDELLRAVAARLSGVLRDTDTVGRLGGDEFVVLVEGGSLDAGPELVAERIQLVLSEPFVLAGTDDLVIHAHASIGIATGVRASADDLLRDADVALYEAKDAGKNCYVLFAPEMQQAVSARIELEMDMRDSVGNQTGCDGEFFLVYQPTFDLRRVRVTGVEALLRWAHPTRGLIMPDTFIPVAEQSGLIVPLGRWVLHEACRQAAGWAADGHPLAISVNVSARQLDTGESFLDTVRTVLAETGLDPALLTLEITESLLMRDAHASAAQLHALKRLGVRIAIDDFGTGYSSLAYLQQFPVDALKIDRSFISGIASGSESSALIRTLVQLGKTLGIETLAEGIEDHDQLQELQRDQCDSGQGYLFARPLTLNDLRTFINLQPGHHQLAMAQPRVLADDPRRATTPT